MRNLMAPCDYLVQTDRPKRALDYICYSSNGSDIRCAYILARRPFTLYLQGSRTLYTRHSVLFTSSYVSSEVASKLTSGMRTQLSNGVSTAQGLRSHSINACNFSGALQCF